MASIVQASLAALLLLPMVRAQDPPLHNQLEPQAHLSSHPRQPVSFVYSQPSPVHMAGVSASIPTGPSRAFV